MGVRNSVRLFDLFFLGASSIAATSAAAADLPTDKAPPAPVIDTFNPFSGWEFHAQGEVGIYGSGSNPQNGLNGDAINYGNIYEDHLNSPTLNQILLTLTKPVDPKATGYAFGFTGQAIYGADMRYSHFLGIDAFVLGSQRNQVGLAQAYVAAHLPWFTPLGVDAKIGLYASPMGNEGVDPSINPLYSHSYTYQYGVTFNDTGILTTTHINSTVDFWLGVDTGNQTTFGSTTPGAAFGDYGDPNGEPAGYIGFGLNNLLNNKLTVLALSHIGPEQAPNFDPTGYRKDMRYYNDAVFTYHITDALQSVTEVNYTRDDFGNGTGPAEFYSGVETMSYTFNKIFSLNGRGEVARDTKNFFVFSPLVNNGFALDEEGVAAPALAGVPGLGTTYGEATLGLTIKPDVPKPLALVELRPEIRYDRILDGAPLFGSGTGVSRDQFTFGGDFVIGY
jgi:hypothetical protein